MELIPIKTRVMQPPRDDLFAVLDESLTEVREKDVVLVSSKIVAIHQGRCVPCTEIEKAELVEKEAEHLIHTEYRSFPLTIKHHTFLGAAGIDESNSDGHYILLPENLFVAAEEIHTHLKEKYKLHEVGVIITDSRSLPFRYGATGVSLSFWGFAPLEDHKGKEDLFGREMRIERSNVVDGLAAGAAVVSGEVAECQPVVIARGVPDLTFVEKNQAGQLFAPPEDDTFRILYERFLRS